MKKIMLIAFAVFSCNTFAEKLGNTIDIINNSHIPATVTYRMCHNDLNMGTNYRQFPCQEKTAYLGGLDSGKNLFSLDLGLLAPNRNQNYIWSLYITKISSSLGEQFFISPDDQNIQYPPNHYANTCIASTTSVVQNVILLNNFGTNKFYCGVGVYAN